MPQFFMAQIAHIELQVYVCTCDTSDHVTLSSSHLVGQKLGLMLFKSDTYLNSL